ncbi:MAG: DUF998 domain-containing protein [Brevundimonas sp.]
MKHTPDTGLGRLAFGVIVLGVAVLVAAVVWGGAVYPGYDHTRQFISELGARGAVTGMRVSQLGFVPNGVLYAAFCLIAAWLLRRSVIAVIACLLLAANGVGMAGAGVYPCDFECSRADPSAASRLHDLFGGLGYVCAIIGVGMASLWARKSTAPWLASLGVVVLIVSLVGFYGVVAEVERPGLYQRAMETALAVFMLALGWALMRGLRATRL